MAAGGFTRDAAQLRTKWKHLKQDYKVELVRIEKNGAASSRMSYFHLLHEVLGGKPSNAMTYLCEVISNSPPRHDTGEGIKGEFMNSVDGIKTEIVDDDKMETDFYRMAEPQVDIIQTYDVHTQTDSTPEQLMYQKCQSLEKQIKDLKEELRRDRNKQVKLQDKHMRDLLENQKTLMDEYFTKTLLFFKAMNHD
ncbi:uncharacterized protein LOC126842844 isoform X2 [Adelges cooleyi]|nr:uncharacterized protein LOC126842844 isoform X2 [Adelges cooleyi]XP_050435991.1 uncharacterized protein LOC126842844 isoform X2 [Adelges cooleyi]XP_050435992.1 uncharacterized protein LOC126842844 isoform X2 [Adelges cooleyi]